MFWRTFLSVLFLAATNIASLTQSSLPESEPSYSVESDSVVAPSKSPTVGVSGTSRRIETDTSTGSVNYKYVYKIYYENTDKAYGTCNDTASSNVAVVGIHGYVSEELTWNGQTVNATTQCVDTSSCIINPESSNCQPEVTAGADQRLYSYTIDPRDQRVFNCDNYYNCVQLDFNSCYSSVANPECNYLLALPSDLIQNPSLLHYDNLKDPAIVQQQVYQLFYADSECTDFVGLRGLTEGANRWPGFSDTATISCYDAMACLLNHDGPLCSSLGGPSGYINFISQTRNGTAYSCVDEQCKAVPKKCFSYPHFPMCYTRWVSAYTLFSDPFEFFPSTLSTKPTITPTKSPITTPVTQPTTIAASNNTSPPTSLNTTIATFVPTPVFVPNENLQDYAYIIFYSNSDCNNSSVLIQGLVLGERMILRGRSSSTNSCIDEAMCAVGLSSSSVVNDELNRTCSAMNETNKGSVYFVVPEGSPTDSNNYGIVHQCDNRYGNGTCSSVDTCLYTGLVPSCHFSVLTSAEIQSQPNHLLRNIKATNSDNNDENIYYQIFYTDSSCMKFVALHGLILPNLGNETIPTFRDTSIACHDTVACLFNPKSLKCQQLGGLTGTTQLFKDPNNNTNICNEQGNCKSVDGQCTQSAVLPSCYTRILPASDFFELPGKYIVYHSVNESITSVQSSAPSSQSTLAPSLIPSTLKESTPSPSEENEDDDESEIENNTDDDNDDKEDDDENSEKPTNSPSRSIRISTPTTFMPTKYYDWESDDDDLSRKNSSNTFVSSPEGDTLLSPSSSLAVGKFNLNVYIHVVIFAACLWFGN